MDTHLIIGITAGVLSFIAYIWYNITIIKGSTKPNKATWWILTLVGVLILISYYQEGARESIWVPVAYTVGPLIIAILSIKYGEKGWSKLDKFCLISALISILFWFIFDSALIALIINLFIDFVGILPTIVKSYNQPQTEDKTAWILEAVSSVMNLFAIKVWLFQIWIYPVYLAIVNSVIALILIKNQITVKK